MKIFKMSKEVLKSRALACDNTGSCLDCISAGACKVFNEFKAKEYIRQLEKAIKDKLVEKVFVCLSCSNIVKGARCIRCINSKLKNVWVYIDKLYVKLI